MIMNLITMMRVTTKIMMMPVMIIIIIMMKMQMIMIPATKITQMITTIMKIRTIIIKKITLKIMI
jgi:hypothetical protein